jgi:DNA-directed RNA polymerase subunit K/omega
MSTDVFEPVPDDGEALPEPVRVPPIQNRFLFVDVAAQRAKQLRRGARPRLTEEHAMPFKLERVAMSEVEHGLVEYTTPPLKGSGQGEAPTPE